MRYSTSLSPDGCLISQAQLARNLVSLAYFAVLQWFTLLLYYGLKFSCHTLLINCLPYQEHSSRHLNNSEKQNFLIFALKSDTRATFIA